MAGREGEGGPKGLQEQVLARDRCVACGFCAALCPYIQYAADKVRVVHPCGREEGMCFSSCPRVRLDPASMDRFVFGQERSDHLLGEHRALYYARALEGARAPAAQYGGTVTALLALSLSQGMVDGVIAVHAGNNGFPRPGLFLGPEEVKASAGSRYLAVPSLVAMGLARQASLERVALAGRPCQVEAVRNWQMLNGGNGTAHWLPQVGLTIGLFCFWALTAQFARNLHHRIGGGYTRIDVPPEGMVVHGVSGETLIPLEEVRPFIQQGCQSCFDPTSEWADLSVGSTEADPKWNTLVVRTPRGEELVDQAVSLGLLELKPYPAGRLPLLRQAVRQKKLRVLESLEGSTDSFIQMSTAYVRAIKEG